MKIWIRYLLIGLICFLLGGVIIPYFSGRRTPSPKLQREYVVTNQASAGGASSYGDQTDLEFLIGEASRGSRSAHTKLFEVVRQMVAEDQIKDLGVAKELDGIGRQIFLSLLGEALSEMHGARAFRMIGELGADPRESEVMIIAAAGFLGLKQPESLLKFVAEEPGVFESEVVAASVGAFLVEIERDILLEELDTLPTKLRQNAMLSLARSFAEDEDLERGLEWIESMSDLDEKRLVTRQLIYTLAETNPELAGSWVSEVDNVSDKTAMANVLMRSWPKVDPETAFAWLESSTAGQVKNSALRQFTITLIEQESAPVASGYIPLMTHGRGREDSIDIVANGWAREDPIAAIEWTKSLDDSEKSEALRSALQGWAQTDPAAVVDYVSSSSGVSKDEFQSLLPTWVVFWGRKEPEGAVEWAVRSGDTSLIEAAAVSAAYSDPALAFSSLEQIGDEESRQRIANDILSNTSNQDPAKSFDLLVNLPDGIKSDSAIRTVIGKWIRYSPLEASEAVTAMPYSPDRDVAAIEIAHYLMGKGDFESSFAWASDVSDEQKRQEWMRKAYNGAQTKDPAGAEALLQDLIETDRRMFR